MLCRNFTYLMSVMSVLNLTTLIFLGVTSQPIPGALVTTFTTMIGTMAGVYIIPPRHVRN